ncbi:ABC transporter permease [Gorillibacterium sp. sgz5001074]|uniref:ABC transporter permease n=1 Tax=Gorillibacterium sp. sgz5001074 TaxID=3446695 RepID=UPI003F674C65
MISQQKWINPVLEKEFRLRMRTLRSPLSVLFYVLVVVLLAMGFIYMNMSTSGAGYPFNPNRSRELFYFLSGAQLILIAFMTPGLTAGVVSGEREKQTLNILLTTQQSSVTIVLSKLVSSLSFMVLLIIATLPVYSIVFLFGGIAPSQLLWVFLFYLFVMFVLGSFGVFFSTVLKKTMVSVIVTYGAALLMFGGTGLAAIFLYATFFQGGGWGPGFVLGLNPMGTLISIFSPDFSKEIFGRASGMQLWYVFVPSYTVVSCALLSLSVRFLRPVYRNQK